MRVLLALILSFTVYFNTQAQLVAKMETKEPIQGFCNSNDVYVIFPAFKRQSEAECPLSKKEILNKLDSMVTYLKDNPTTQDKGMVNIIINCKGEVVKCEMDNKTKSPILDRQIVAVFSSLGLWKPGKIKKKPSILPNCGVSK